MTEQSFVFIGEKKISHLWYRLVLRPPHDLGVRDEDIDAVGERRILDHHPPKVLPGRVEDNGLLNEISRLIWTVAGVRSV